MSIYYKVSVILSVLFFVGFLQAQCKWKDQYESGGTLKPWGSLSQTISMQSLNTVSFSWDKVLQDEVKSNMDNLGSTNVNFTYGGRTGFAGQIQPISGNNENEFGTGDYSRPDAGGVTLFTFSGVKIVETDVFMNIENINFTWGLPDGAHEWTAVRHELGHCVGLPHNTRGFRTLSGFATVIRKRTTRKFH